MTKKWLLGSILILSMVALPSCFLGGESDTVSVDDLEQQIAIKLSTENTGDAIIKLNAVTCYDPLLFTAGSQSRCSVNDGSGGTFWVTAVSSGQSDGAANFEIMFDT